ncbi:MAG: sulfotransferase family 2 domain-containing protein [candidate division Zixibacteria bacterium]
MASPDKMTRLFFLHIPKAGGTTFYDIIYRNFAYRKVAKIDGTQVAESIADLSAQPMAVKKRFDSVIGHFTFGFHQQFSGKYTYITFLRDPVSRVVSLFNHIKNVSHHPLHEVVASKGMDIHSFATSDLTREIDNDQVRRIAGSNAEVMADTDLAQAVENLERSFAFVGVSEEYDQSLVLLRRLFPRWDVRYVARNIGRADIGSSQQVHEKTLENIERRNRLDVALYRYVRARFNAALQEMGGDLDAEVAELRSRNARLWQYEKRFAFPLQHARLLRQYLRSKRRNHF